MRRIRVPVARRPQGGPAPCSPLRGCIRPPILGSSAWCPRASRTDLTFPACTSGEMPDAFRPHFSSLPSSVAELCPSRSKSVPVDPKAGAEVPPMIRGPAQGEHGEFFDVIGIFFNGR